MKIKIKKIGSFVFGAVLFIILSFLVMLAGAIVSYPELHLNLNNYRDSLILEAIFVLVLPLIIFLASKGNKMFVWNRLDEKNNNPAWYKILSKVFVVMLVLGYLYFGVVRLILAATQKPEFIKSSNCYAYYTSYRRNHNHYILVVNDRKYRTNYPTLVKIANNINGQVYPNIHYSCANTTLVILPLIYSVIDIKYEK